MEEEGGNSEGNDEGGGGSDASPSPMRSSHLDGLRLIVVGHFVGDEGKWFSVRCLVLECICKVSQSRFRSCGVDGSGRGCDTDRAVRGSFADDCVT